MARRRRQRALLAELVGSGIGATSNAAASLPAVTLLLLAIVTVGLGSGLQHVHFEENLLEVLPRDHPDTLANLNMSRDFPGHHSYVNVNFKIDPEKWPAANARLPTASPLRIAANGRAHLHRAKPTDGRAQRERNRTNSGRGVEGPYRQKSRGGAR